MNREKEPAFRYDLFITPDWRDRYDTLINEAFELPTEGRVLDVNCGTGAHAIELAERFRGKGEVIATDPSLYRVEIARAKAQVKKLTDVEFHQALASDLPFNEDEFDLVIGDASMLPADHVEDVLAEMVRVAQPGARVILKLATKGSFDEFFSIYWEALHDAGIVEEVWSELEALINERATVSDAEAMARRAGLRKVESFSSKEEFDYETGSAFIESPLIQDMFLEDWLAIVPEEHREDVEGRIVSLIERDRAGGPFDVSIKATLIAGTK
jgi:ubiquinone/menaquinone biosynthesis C-methylase UbiE